MAPGEPIPTKAVDVGFVGRPIQAILGSGGGLPRGSRYLPIPLMVTMLIATMAVGALSVSWARRQPIGGIDKLDELGS